MCHSGCPPEHGWMSHEKALCPSCLNAMQLVWLSSQAINTFNLIGGGGLFIFDRNLNETKNLCDRISGERWIISPDKHKSLFMRRFPELGKSIFFVRDKKKVEYSVRNPLHLMPLAFVLRSWVAPLRCPLSYTSANIGKVLDITKTFSTKVAKKGKVSHEVGQKKGETSQFHPKCSIKFCFLSLPKQFGLRSKTLVSFCIEYCEEVGLLIQSECVRC